MRIQSITLIRANREEDRVIAVWHREMKSAALAYAKSLSLKGLVWNAEPLLEMNAENAKKCAALFGKADAVVVVTSVDFSPILFGRFMRQAAAFAVTEEHSLQGKILCFVLVGEKSRVDNMRPFLKVLLAHCARMGFSPLMAGIIRVRKSSTVTHKKYARRLVQELSILQAKHLREHA